MPRSILRQFALWFFRYPPYSPYVTANVSVDIGPAQRYLDVINADATPGQVRVSLMHLLTALLGRLYQEFPQANARVLGGRIRRHDGVGVALPVDLIGHRGGASMELSLVLVDHAERRSLTEIAAWSRRSVDAERDGRPGHPLVGALKSVAERTPAWLFHGVLDVADRAAQSRLLSPLAHRLMPVSIVLTNPGAVLRVAEGVRFIGATMTPPNRLCPVGSVLGVSAVQDEVLAVRGAPAVRPMLPLSYVFDHRLFDGVMCGRILLRLSEMLRDPARALGPNGAG